MHTNELLVVKVNFRFNLAGFHSRLSSRLALRTRSTSRKRVMDDDEPARSPVRAHHNSPFGPYGRRAAISNHSSPGSAGSLPSPPMSHAETILEEQQPAFAEPQSPTLQGMYAYNGLDGVQQPQFSPDWSTNPNVVGQGSSTLPTESSFSGYNRPASQTYDNGGYPSYGGSYGTMMDMNIQPEAFPGVGLPFSGLEFIQNYPPDGYSTDPTSGSLWQTLDPGAFIQDPEMPFSFQDFQDPNVGEFVHMDGQSPQ